MQSAIIAKVRETFWHLICPYPLRDRRVVVGGRWLGWPWLGPGLVRVVCVSLGLFLQSPGQEKHLDILSTSYFVGYSCLYRNTRRDNG